MKVRGKTPVRCIALVALAVLVASAVAFKDAAVERYYLWKLEGGDETEAEIAAGRLAAMGSVRAVPILLQKLRGGYFLPGVSFWDIDGDGEQDPFVLFDPFEGGGASISLQTANWITLSGPTAEEPIVEALTRITKLRGPACVPHLTDALAGEDWSCRFLAVELLGGIGPRARAAVPALIEALRAPPESTRVSGQPWVLGDVSGDSIVDIWRAHWDINGRSRIARTLGQIGPDARQAIPALTELSQEKESVLRRAAAEALKKIQGNER